MLDSNVLTFGLDYAGKAKMSEFFEKTKMINKQSMKCTLVI